MNLIFVCAWRMASPHQRYFPAHFLCDVSVQELSARRHWAALCGPVERPAQAEPSRLLQRGSTHWLVQPRFQGLRSPALSKAQCRLGTAAGSGQVFSALSPSPSLPFRGSLLIALSSSPCGCPLLTSVAFVAGSSLCALSSSPGSGHLPFQFHQAPPVLWHGAAPLRFSHVSYPLPPSLTMVPHVLQRSSVPQGGQAQKGLCGLTHFLRRWGFVGLVSEGEFGSILPVKAKASSAY